MGVIIVILLGIIAFGVIKAMVRGSYARAMTQKDMARRFALGDLENDRIVPPTWYPKDNKMFQLLMSNVIDGLECGGVNPQEAREMAQHPYIQASAIGFASAYERAGMSKIEQVAAVGTDFQERALGIKKKYDDIPK